MNPFKVTLYDKHLERTGWLNDWTSLLATPRHMAVGRTVIRVPTNHRKLPLLAAKGARVVVEFQGEHLMSGYIKERTYELPRLTGTAEFTVHDDLDLLWRMLGWPVPGSTIGAQGTKQDTRTGPAETVAKGFVAANLAHNTVDPITVAANLGRGSTITVSSRMMPLADQLVPAVDTAGIGLSARQVGNRIVVDAYTPGIYPHTLREEAGTVLSGTFSSSDPITTSTVIGGPNEGTAREFRAVTSAALETEYGYRVETFTDARSTETTAEMDAAGQETLLAGRPKAGLSLGLSESSIFRYAGANGIRVGDQVSVDIGDGDLITDVIREARLSMDRENGLVVTPTVGDRTDDPDKKLGTLLAAAFRGLRDLRTR